MAVTQISKIQIRRGRKLSPTGIPQLAGGEFAWSVDSQELFIGNGAVAEGAPYVGNTKVLTEHDNILALVSSYRFAGDDPSIPASVPRSFQRKLDEYVSVADFGAIPDGITDNKEAFESAFQQLFLNANPIYKKILLVPNGEYAFYEELQIPQDVTLQGETAKGAILKFGTTVVKFVTDTAFDIDEFTINNRPENIRFANLTVQGGQIIISGSRSVSFDGVIFEGVFNLEDSTLETEDSSLIPGADESAIVWYNQRPGLQVTDVSFKNCRFINHLAAVRCEQSLAVETVVNFDSCIFERLETGILVIGVANQINKWTIKECKFFDTSSHGIYISNGIDTLIKDCAFERCGNTYNGDPIVASVFFGQNKNNRVLDCITDRQQTTIDSNTPGELALINYIPEVEGADLATFTNRNFVLIQKTDSAINFAALPGRNKFIKINYTLRLRDTVSDRDVRHGTLQLTLDYDSNTVNMSDNYTYSSQLGKLIGYQESTTLFVTNVTFGQLWLGATISGDSVTLGTTINQLDETPDPGTQGGIYGVDRTPILSPTQIQEFSFTRDTMFKFTFFSEFADDSTGTVLLSYQNQTSTGLPGDLSFEVSYGV
jgi:hypothetical protein